MIRDHQEEWVRRRLWELGEESKAEIGRRQSLGYSRDTYTSPSDHFAGLPWERHYSTIDGTPIDLRTAVYDGHEVTQIRTEWPGVGAQR